MGNPQALKQEVIATVAETMIVAVAAQLQQRPLLILLELLTDHRTLLSTWVRISFDFLRFRSSIPIKPKLNNHD